MVKLNQVTALLKGKKTSIEKSVTDLYKIVQKPELFTGRQRVYRPFDAENGTKLPPEFQKIQHYWDKILAEAKGSWVELWDLVLTQDTGNQQAKANIVIDDKIIAEGVPVTNLLFLEKQVNDLESFLNKLPTPDPSENWTYDTNQGCLRSETSETIRTQKEPSHYVKAPATPEHPAQVEFFHKDVGVGTWLNTVFSGACPVDRKRDLLKRVTKLKDAIKLARENANALELKPAKLSEQIFEYLGV